MTGADIVASTLTPVTVIAGPQYGATGVNFAKDDAGAAENDWGMPTGAVAKSAPERAASVADTLESVVAGRPPVGRLARIVLLYGVVRPGGV